MKIDTLFTDGDKWILDSNNITEKDKASIVFLFGDSDEMTSEHKFNAIKTLYPSAHIIGASSSGNILGPEISNTAIVATAIQFEKGRICISKIDFASGDDVEVLSQNLMEQLPAENLQHVFVLSDGLNINGSELVRGINKVARGVPVSGGMAGDGDRFQQTWVVADEPARQNRVVAVGFYGDDFVISTGYNGGWSSFGADRIVTKSDRNILYELDGKPALDLYKQYLGDYAKDLPLSGMRFPLYIKKETGANGVIRTLLNIDEESKSITFAGDIPEGYIARLMKPDLNNLITGASIAAEYIEKINSDTALGLVVSCVGRRVVLNDMIEDELEEIDEILGKNVKLTGFYSYGEFAPFQDEILQCQLHNQTMTLTAIYEK